LCDIQTNKDDDDESNCKNKTRYIRETTGLTLIERAKDSMQKSKTATDFTGFLIKIKMDQRRPRDTVWVLNLLARWEEVCLRSMDRKEWEIWIAKCASHTMH